MNREQAVRYCIKLSSSLHLTLLLVCAFITPSAKSATPWFTGPLITPSGITIAKGHTNIEIYQYDQENTGLYGDNGFLIHTPRRSMYQTSVLFTHGITDRMDVEFILPYAYIRYLNTRKQNIGDSSSQLGLQLARQGDLQWLPNIRLVFQETFPTGKFDELSAGNVGTDAMGLGSYQSAFMLNMQSLAPFGKDHYLRTRFSIGHTFMSNVSVNGYNTYGGGMTTKGIVKPGNMSSVELSGELTVTQHWVLVMEGIYLKQNMTTFTGRLSIDPNEKVPPIGGFGSNQYSVAPAIEYNFSQQVGLIGGVWFTYKGHNIAQFTAFTLALNLYF